MTTRQADTLIIGCAKSAIPLIPYYLNGKGSPFSEAVYLVKGAVRRTVIYYDDIKSGSCLARQRFQTCPEELAAVPIYDNDCDGEMWAKHQLLYYIRCILTT